MTEEVGTLAHLLECGAGQDEVARFEARWQGERLVMDKWFSLQILCAAPDQAAAVTAKLAQQMMAAGLRARISTLDPKKLDASLGGHEFDPALLAALPAGVDPCGENGEFHTLAWDGPMFHRPLAIRVGETVLRDGFVFTDLLPADLPIV